MKGFSCVAKKQCENQLDLLDLLEDPNKMKILNWCENSSETCCHESKQVESNKSITEYEEDGECLLDFLKTFLN